jgi:hypothetical protein
VWAIAVLSLCVETPRGEEWSSVASEFSSTFLSGFVDTSANWSPAAPSDVSLNDAFADAIQVQTGKILVPTNLTTATLEAGEPIAGQKTGSVWYKWTAPVNGIARVSTNALYPMPIPAAISTNPALSDESIFYDGGGVSWTHGETGGTFIRGPRITIGYWRWTARLVVYRGSAFSNLSLVSVSPDFEFSVQAGETIWICIEVYESGPAYDGQPLAGDSLPEAIYLDMTPPPSNDSFVSTLAVADSAGGVMEGYLLGATRETGEPDLGAEDFSGGSVWFHYSAATFGTVTLTPSTNISFVVFSGSDLSNLQVITKSAGVGVSFFGEEGKLYHVAVYQGTQNSAGFSLSYSAPKYRLYETNLDGLMPNGIAPHFYGVRGVTMLFYAKTTTGWDLVEVEPIVNQAADLLIRPSGVVDGQLRVITIDEALPSPRVILSTADGLLNVNLAGIPGQTCGVSYSTDLLQWSPARIITLKSAEAFVHSFDPAGSNYFFRVTRFAPRPPVTPPPIPTQ